MCEEEDCHHHKTIIPKGKQVMAQTGPKSLRTPNYKSIKEKKSPHPSQQKRVFWFCNFMNIIFNKKTSVHTIKNQDKTLEKRDKKLEFFLTKQKQRIT